MGKTALLAALKTFDLASIRRTLDANPGLKEFRSDKALNLLQICCSRPTYDDAPAAMRQVRLAQWLVEQGFDATAIHTTAPGDDGDAESARLSLVWFAVARARNNRLARYFLRRGADANAVFAAVWWANSEILPDLVAHGGKINQVVGATPLHMAVSLLPRAGAPAAARLKTVKRLLALGADVNVAAFDGTTPLRTVLDRDAGPAVFRALLAHGADPDARGKDGRTVREVAARKRDKRYLRALPPVRYGREV